MAKNNIRFGGADIFISESTSGPWTDLGHLNNVSMTENWTPNKIHSHNKGFFLNTISEHVLSVSADALQFDIAIWEKIRGSLDTYTTQAGTLVSGATQDVAAFKYTTFVGIENQNGDGSALTVTSVTQDPDGAATALVENTDFIVMADDSGRSGIMVLDTGNTDDTKSLLIVYDYTPYASKTMTTGQAIQVPARALKIVQKTAGEDKIDVVIPYAKTAEGLNISFGDTTDPAEPLAYNVAFEAEVDPVSGNLFTFKFIDEGWD